MQDEALVDRCSIVPAWVQAQGLTHCFVYRGKSMFPGLRPGDLLFVRQIPIADLRVGDLVVFNPPDRAGFVVHRLVAITSAGYITQGDANSGHDDSILTAANLFGRTELLERKGKILPVPGTRRGRWFALLHPYSEHFGHVFRWVAGFPYRALRNSNAVRRLLSRAFAPHLETASFQTPQGLVIKFVHRGKVVAQWYPDANLLECRKPYDLILPRLDQKQT